MKEMPILFAKIKSISTFFGFIFGAMIALSIGVFFKDYVDPIQCCCIGSWIGLVIGYIYGKLLIRLL